MKGVITTKHLFTHAGTIVRQFGVRCYIRCVCRSLFSNKPVTFLDCIR